MGLLDVEEFAWESDVPVGQRVSSAGGEVECQSVSQSFRTCIGRECLHTSVSI